MILLATFITILAVFFMQDKGVLTQKPVKKILSAMSFVFAGILLSMEYGTLRAVFILIGLASLLGTLLALLLYRLQPDK